MLYKNLLRFAVLPLLLTFVLEINFTHTAAKGLNGLKSSYGDLTLVAQHVELNRVKIAGMLQISKRQNQRYEMFDITIHA